MVKSPHVETLDKLISQVILQASTDKKSTPESNYSPLMTIQTRRRHKKRISCFPGAGGNVTAFNDLAKALGAGLSIYGLQPRGLDGVIVPHSSVYAAAAAYLRAIHKIYLSRRPYASIRSLIRRLGGVRVGAIVSKGRT